MRAWSMLFVMLLMILISSLISPMFFSYINLMNILNQNAIYGIMAVGMACVLVCGCIDLSVGSIAALAGVITVPVFEHYGLIPGIMVGIIVGIMVGFVNGTLVTRVGIAPFVVTLGMQQAVRGIVYLITNGVPVKGVPSAFNFIGYGKIAGIPVSAIIWVTLAVVMYLIMRYTTFGQHLYSVGGNETASWLSGVNVKKIKTSAYMLSGMFAAIAGVLMTLRVLQATADAGTAYETTAIASCIVGGIAMEGGQGSVLSSIVGAIIMGLILNLLQLMGVSSYWQSTVTGVIIIGAVALDCIINRKRSK